MVKPQYSHSASHLENNIRESGIEYMEAGIPHVHTTVGLDFSA